MKKYLEGFSRLQFSLLATGLIIVGLLGGCLAVFVTHDYHAREAALHSRSLQSKPVAVNIYKGWRTYCDTLHIGCLKYPAAWQVSETHTGPKPGIQITASGGSPHQTSVSYSLKSVGPVTSASDKIQWVKHLAKPVTGLTIYEGTVRDTPSPYIVLADGPGNWDHTTAGHTWSLSATPGDLPYDRSDQAMAWFASPEAKTALHIVQSFSYQ